MEFSTFSNSIKTVKLQRNYSLCINVFFGFVIAMLLMMSFIRSNKYTTVVIPARLSSAVTITQDGVDEAFLTQWSSFIAGLKLNVTPDSVSFKQKELLPYIDSSKYGEFKSHLISEQENVKQNEISTVFYPNRTKIVDLKNLITEISGVIRVYIGDTLNKEAKVTYRLSFSLYGGKLMLLGFEEVKNA